MDTPTQDSAAEPPIRVLLVDDDPMWRFIASEALRQRGFEVTDREDASDIVAQVQGVHPDLVIVDAMMPGIDGFAACRMLRQSPASATLPVLMMTGLDDEPAISRAYESGASDFFIKSTHWALLAQRVRHLVRVAEMQDELQVSQARLQSARSAGQTGQWEYDVERDMLVGDPGALLLLGLEEGVSSIPGALFRAMVDPSERSTLEALMLDALRTRERATLRVPVLTRAGEPRILELEGEPAVVSDGRVRTFRGVMRDVTERELARAEMRRLAAVDPLTGLSNRASFLSACDEALAGARASGRDMTVAVLDIDRFSLVNERFGQEAGDDMLCQMGRRIVEVCERHRPGQDAPVVARLGGDEFAVLVGVGCLPAAVDTLLDRLLESMREPWMLAGNAVMVPVSIGVAQYPRDGDTAGQILARADLANASVKASGRNGVHRWYSPSMDGAARVRLDLATDLRRALDQGELELHYQPVIDVCHARTAAVEALMRWRRSGALVSPADFIPLAEETGMIIPMGEWAIRRACTDLAGWRDQGLDIDRVAVNLPSMHFELASLVDVVKASLDACALPAHALELELTETALMRDLDRTLERLRELRDLGVIISVDDFGTGYSSLAYLTRLPVGKLKIDRSFVGQLGQSPQSDAIVRAIVALGGSLQMQVVAEGVETAQQAAQLAAVGCILMQGYLFSKPVPASQIPGAIEQAMQVLHRASLTPVTQPAGAAALTR